jgi:hypothetical protein
MESNMKIKIALCLLAVASLSACTTTKTTSSRPVDEKGARYANNSEPAPPAEGPGEGDIPSEGPADVNTNPAYVPTPLLRTSAASQP